MAADVSVGEPQIMGVHPYADKFPMLPAAEFAELVVSVERSGLRQPIVVTPDGMILDGRNRFAACTEAGVVADRVIYDGDDLAEYVIDANSSRRHMSTGARAMATALVLASDGRREGGRWRRGSVDVGNDQSVNNSDWQQRLRKCGVVLDFAPDLADHVVSGDLALDAAFRKAEDRRDAERHKLEEQERLATEEADARAFIEENAPDLASRVDGTDLLTYVEARDLWNRRNREEAEQIAREKAEADRKAAQERRARSDLYSGIAQAVQTIGTYGRYDDIPALMAEYARDELDPPQLSRAFEPQHLDNAARFIAELTTWRNTR